MVEADLLRLRALLRTAEVCAAAMGVLEISLGVGRPGVAVGMREA
jgi:hypothetical protein